MYTLMSPGISWGHLQRNKAKDAVELFSLIHSLDSIRLARELDRRCEMADSTIDLLLQVNISGETTKFGVPPEMARDVLLEIARYERLRVRGLMVIAPYSDNPEDSRPWFSQARNSRASWEGFQSLT